MSLSESLLRTLYHVYRTYSLDLTSFLRVFSIYPLATNIQHTPYGSPGALHNRRHDFWRWSGP